MINTHATSVHQHQKKSIVQVCVNIKNYSVALILLYFGDKFMLFLRIFLRRLCFFNKQIATFDCTLMSVISKGIYLSNAFDDYTYGF
jgi:hypothetical protein